MPTKPASNNERIVCWSGCQRAVIRAPDHNTIFGRSRSQWALIRAPDRKKFVWRSGSQWALIRAPDRNFDRSGSQCALIRAPGRKNSLGEPEIICALRRAPIARTLTISKNVSVTSPVVPQIANELWLKLPIGRELLINSWVTEL